MSARGELLVEVSGLASQRGFVRGLIFTGKEGFPESRQLAIAEASVEASEAKNGTVLLRFPTFEGGRGVVSVFHDLDGSGTMKKGLFGMPKEPLAMTNWDGKSRPSYEKCVGKLVGRLALKLRRF